MQKNVKLTPNLPQKGLQAISAYRVKTNLTAFFMPAFATAKAIFTSLLLLLSLNSLAAEHFSIDNPTITKIGNGYTLDANIRYPLTPRVIEALENGVPITFLQHFQLSQPFPIIGKHWPWGWQKTLWSTVIAHELRYHALSEQYILLTLGNNKQRSFPSLETALTALGKIHAFNLPPEYDIEPNVMTFEIRTELDIHALPTPMRPGALVSDKWQIASPWVSANWP
jgi:hypothetical protein